ncbi:MAG: hypothetical protein AAGN35_20365 [Bacteroidota bacterium]
MAQNQIQVDAIVGATDTFALQQYAPIIANRMQSDLLLAQQWALQNGYPAVQPTANGGMVKVWRPLRDDFYEYMGTDNAISVRTVSTDAVRFGGSLNLDLTGAGYTVRIWDEGMVFNHQEYPGRAVIGGIGDMGTMVSDHATHVSGTLISSGNIVPASKGMAPLGRVGFETIDFDIAEMINGASAGLFLSNHSYSVRMGWRIVGNTWYWEGDVTVSPTEDYRFGFYDGPSRDFDFVAFHAPYHLIVKSAGNNRQDIGPPPGGFHLVQIGGQLVGSNSIRNPDGP